MDLLQLKYFVKIVEHKSFTKAARACNVSQPALSQQLRKLEDELGQQLLERRGRTVLLTSSGQLLFDRAGTIIRLVDDTIAELTDDGESGRLSIAAIPTVGPFLLPSLIESLVPQFPKARFTIGEDVTDEIIAKCCSGELNVGVLAMPARSKHLTFEPLFEEELLVCLNSQHPLASSATLTAEQLADETILLLGKSHCLSGSVENFCNDRKIASYSTSRIQQLSTIKQLVALGQGITFVPRMAIGDNLDGRVVYRSMTDSRPTRTIAICYDSSRYQSQLLENFMKAMRELADPAMVGAASESRFQKAEPTRVPVTSK